MNAASLRNAIRNAPSEELVTQRSMDHSAYIELVKAMLDRIECVTNREDLTLNVDQEVNKINALIDIMREKNIQPKCKRLHDNTLAMDFTSASEDTDTMNTARTAVDNEIPKEKAITDWNENNRANSRNKQSKKYCDLWKRWADSLALKTTRDPETISEASYASTSITPCTTPQNTHPYTIMDIPREIIKNIPVFDRKPDELNQFLSTINAYTTMYNI